MSTPLRLDMILPNGQPLRWNTPGATWGGTVEDVMAASNQQNQNTMSSQNNISATLAAGAVTNIIATIATIRTNLPFLINLTPSQRKNLAHAASSGQGVIQDALTFAAQHPEALPASFDTAEFAKDGALLTPYAPVVAAIASLNEDVNDTSIALQADLYSEFLDVYAFAKANNRNGAYNTFVDAIKVRFAKSARKPATPTPPAA